MQQPPTFLREDDLVDDNVAAVNLKLGQLLRSGEHDVPQLELTWHYANLPPSPAACAHASTCTCSFGIAYWRARDHPNPTLPHLDEPLRLVQRQELWDADAHKRGQLVVAELRVHLLDHALQSLERGGQGSE